MTHVTRKTLYQRVWDTPGRRLAAEYGLSDVGLAKLCRRHDIPRPPRGYWAKLQHGQTPPTTPLPHPERNETITIAEPDRRAGSQSPTPHSIKERIEAEQRRVSEILVDEMPTDFDPLIRRARHILERAETDRDKLIVPTDELVFHCRVSHSCLDRSLQLLNALAHKFKQCGYGFGESPVVEIFGHWVRFGLIETTDQQYVACQDHQLSGHYTFGHSKIAEREFPTGRLMLTILDKPTRSTGGFTRHWSDTSSAALESRLDEVVKGLIKWAARHSGLTDESRTVE
jgi:hypothetical protein